MKLKQVAEDVRQPRLLKEAMCLFMQTIIQTHPPQSDTSFRSNKAHNHPLFQDEDISLLNHNCSAAELRVMLLGEKPSF